MASSPDSIPLIAAVDTGGTFTDAVARRGDRVAVAKVPSTPDDPSRAVASALERVSAELGAERVDVLVHGTTVATNALLERRGAPTWLVTNAGFEDLLAVGRQTRQSLYALEPVSRPVLVPRDQVVGVAGRLDRHGVELEPLALDALDAVLDTLRREGASPAWAVCLLHAYANPAHEQAVAARIRAVFPDASLSVSSDVLPVFREVERASTTVANAFVQPLMTRYLARLGGLAERVAVMASSGGRLTLGAAQARPALTALSGPAGGVVAALHVARSESGFGGAAPIEGVISFDMGGTSTDVALCREALPIRHESEVGPFPIHLPTLDIHTVGAGGGSIASVDAGGALAVGPESAGADPGPACYGRGERATVTDANVVLGHLPADTLLGGEHPIYPERARQAVQGVADALGVSLERAAEGILEVAVETMARAIRKVSVERGVDPRDLALCAFGGAGGLHACALAEALGMTRVVVPAHAGLLSAVGMLRGVAVAERSRTVLGLDATGLTQVFGDLERDAEGALGEPTASATLSVDLRYAGQSFELAVPWQASAAPLESACAAFEEAHEERFGYRLDAAIEPVTARVRLEGALPSPLEVREAGVVPTTVVGPAPVVQLASTTWVAAGWVATLAADGALWIERSA